MVVLVRALVLVLLAGCGRIGFDAPGGDEPGLDAASDVGTTDLMVGLRMWIPIESGATPLRDVIGGRDPTCTPCPATTSEARGVVLPLVTDCLEFVDAPELAAQEFSLALWFLYAGSSSGSVFGKAYDGANRPWNSWELWMRQSRSFEFKTTANNVYNASVVAPSIPRDEWHHAVAVMSAARKALYIDGQLISEEVSPAGPLVFDADPVRIGCDEDNGTLGQFFEGAVDDLRFYDRVLSPAEIGVLATP